MSLAGDGKDGSRGGAYVIAKEQAAQGREEEGQAGHAPVYGGLYLLIL